MIQMRTLLKVADNSGAKLASCIQTIGGSKRMTAKIGEIIVVSIKEALPSGSVKRKTVQRAVIVRQKAPIIRPDGTVVRFDDNAVVILDEAKKPKGTRIFGPIAREVKEAGMKTIASLAKEIV